MRLMVNTAATFRQRALGVMQTAGPIGFAGKLRSWLSEQRRSMVVSLDSRGIPRLTTRYQRWVEAQALSTADLAQQRTASRELAYRPTISLITPVYDPPPEVLTAMIQSVLSQTYERWELCLADGASGRAGVRQALEELAARDQRIRLRALARNEGISGNSNEAARCATGDFLLLLDHDDLLAPEALFEIVSALNTHRDADLIYYDEDMVTADGARRFHPLFKPDWSPELMLSVNYLTHATIRRTLFWEAGGFDSTFDGAQDWDLVLRCTERTRRVVHVPKVLYHWRAVPGSAAASFNAKPYVFERQLRCVAEHVRREGIDRAAAHFASSRFVRVNWPTRGSMVSIIVPTWKNSGPQRASLDALLRITAYPDYEIVLVGMGSSGRTAATTLEHVTSDPRVRVVERRGELNDAAASNWGARQATGDILLFVRPGVAAFEPDWLEELVRWAERPAVGIVGAKILGARHRIKHAGLVLGLEGVAGHIFQGVRERQDGPFGNVDWYRNYAAVSGACQMMRREVFEVVGGFDEEYRTAFGDVDLCLRVLAAGYRHVYTPYARLYDTRRDAGKERASSFEVGQARKRVQALFSAGDPYFNPNLSRTHCVPTVMAPAPRALDLPAGAPPG